MKKKTKIKKVSLPYKLSGLIKLAIKDLKLVMKDKRYELALASDWHYPLNDKCHVCLAGAVLAKSCGVKINEEAGPYFSKYRSIESRLLAIDSMRQGYFEDAYDHIKDKLSKKLSDLEMKVLENIDRNMYPGSGEETIKYLENKLPLLELLGI